MDKFKKINKFLKKLIYIALFFLLLGLSYAFFTANITGSESSTTITAGGGTMDITFSGGSNITMSNMYPREAVWGTKSFTVTGNNTTTLTMYYNLNLVIESNTFSYGSLKYKLTSTNTGSNGTVVPSTITMEEIGSGARTILLGNGTFTGPTSGDKVHSYTLDFYFPDNGEKQGYDKGKTIAAHIEILEGTGVANNYLTDAIFYDWGIPDNITEAPAGTFENINEPTGLFKMADDYGMSYYFRGEKDYANNNIIFAEQQWKIVRINGDGSIRLIYNGTCPDNSCTINSTGTDTQIGTSAINISSNDAKYFGYMYGGADGVASTSYAGATTNETNSSIKNLIDNWYNANLSSYNDYISDTLFCNDRQVISGPGYGGGGITYYGAQNRLDANKTPNLKCKLQNDRFTKNDETVGNGDLIYPIGLITPDEAAVAGMVLFTGNSSNYLYTAQKYWTLGPSTIIISTPLGWAVSTGGNLVNNQNIGTNLFGVRPVINLKPDTIVTGYGDSTYPYVVQ